MAEHSSTQPPHGAPAAHGASDKMYDVRKDVDNPGTLVVVFLVIVGLALANVGLSMAIGPSKFTLPLQLAIGSVQAGLVGYHFMHLKQGDKVVILTALSSIFWLGILLVLFSADYLSRKYVIGW